MDTIFGIEYNGGVILASDQENVWSIFIYQHNLDKIVPLTSHSMMGVSGPNCDLVRFSEYIARTLQYYQLSHEGYKLSMRAQANMTRNEIATALRKGPYQVNVLLGGYDLPPTTTTTTSGEPQEEQSDHPTTTTTTVSTTTSTTSKKGKPSLYYLDHYGALQKVKYGAMGYAQYFTLGLFDREYKDNLNEQEALSIIDKCIQELKVRFLANQPNFIIKVVDKDGIRIVKCSEKPL